MLGLWLLLAVSLVLAWNSARNKSGSAHATKIIGLAILLAVPFAIYVASSPGLYPAINPSTGGPTGESQLESSLGVVAILLIVPFGIARREPGRRMPLAICAIVFAAEALLCLSMYRGDISHHLPSQYLSLGSLLVWLPLVPAYYATFQWHENARSWRTALLWWWGFLVVSGWIMFLPGVLDHFKFTDGLVGHSLVAVAGFLTALLSVVLVQLLGGDGWILTRRWSFHMWNWSVLAYVVIMLIAGWIEGGDPVFTSVPGLTRNILYTLRLITGVLMLISSAEWLIATSGLLRASSCCTAERLVGGSYERPLSAWISTYRRYLRYFNRRLAHRRSRIYSSHDGPFSSLRCNPVPLLHWGVCSRRGIVVPLWSSARKTHRRRAET